MKKPSVVPKDTAIATAGLMNIAIITATWEAKVKDIGPIIILGINIGMIVPTAINRDAKTKTCICLCDFIVFLLINICVKTHVMTNYIQK